MMNSVQNGTHFSAYDGNGNVSALINASNGEVTANYEYGPFGEPIRVSGTMSTENPFRFSTKRTIDSIDIILYEYRAYSPILGKWLSRDLIGEKGGRNLYGFTLNNPIIYIDTDGRFIGTRCLICGEWYQGFYNCSGTSANGGPGYHKIPYWFEHPAEEGKPCCCKRQAKLKKFQRVDDPPTRTQLSMKMNVELEGCFKDLAKGWWTCWRPGGSAGWMPGFENQDNAKLDVFGITIPGVGGLSTGPHITIACIRYLSCENGKWVKHKEFSSRTYTWENGKWTW